MWHLRPGQGSLPKSCLWTHWHHRIGDNFGLNDLGDVQGPDLVPHEVVELGLDFAVGEVIDVLADRSGMEKTLEGLVQGTGSGHPGGGNET